MNKYRVLTKFVDGTTCESVKHTDMPYIRFMEWLRNEDRIVMEDPKYPEIPCMINLNNATIIVVAKIQEGDENVREEPN